MNKNDSIHLLFKTLTDTLPYEYTEKLTDDETAIVITKEDSDSAMYITPDDVMAIGHDDPNRGYFVEYEPIYRYAEEEQIPLDSIIDDIKNRL